MFNQLIRISKSPAIDFILKLIINLALLCFVAPIVIQLKLELPLALQTLVILLVAIAFGWQLSLVAILIYIVLGASGVPVFSGHTSGLNQLTGQYGGFFFGYAIAAVVVGYLAEIADPKKPFHHMGLWFLGHFIILLLGAIWLMRLLPDDWWPMIQIALSGSLVQAAFGFLLTQTLARMFMKREEYFGKG